MGAALLYHAHHHMTTPRSALITASSINPDKPNKNAHAAQQAADGGAMPHAGAAEDYCSTADLSNTAI
jgi:hypothetical protein